MIHLRKYTLRAYILGVITGSMMTAGLSILAAPARADVGPGTIDAYGQPICETLDAYPSNSGIKGVAQFLILDQGYTADDAADIVVGAVFGYCPQHIGTLQRFADTYRGTSSGTVA